MKAASAIAVLALAGAAQAQIFVADLGTGAPPATVGGYTMTPFGADSRNLTDFVADVTVADGAPFDSLTFSPLLQHFAIGQGWGTWSHGYTGDVYASNDGANTVTIGLPASTGAFYFYAEPNPFQVFNITATANDGTVLTLAVDGLGGANGFGFWTTGPALTSVTVASDAPFAVGEFGLARAVPAPGAAALLGLGGLIASRRRR